MKPINYLLDLMFAMVTFVSCDTYGDYEQEFAPIYPLSGQYYVKVLDENNEELVISTTKDDDESYNVYGTYLYLYNTADNDKDKLWIKLPNTSLFKQGILGKISCNVEELTFNGTAGNMVADGTTPVGEFTVTSGKVTLESVTTPTNGKADGIEVKYTLEGKTYTIKGFRRTGWDDDETWVEPITTPDDTSGSQP